MRKIWLGVVLGIMSVIAVGVVGAAGLAGAFYWKYVTPLEKDFKEHTASFVKHAHEAIESWPEPAAFNAAWEQLSKDWRALCALGDASPGTFTKRGDPLNDIWTALVAPHSFLQSRDFLKKAIEDEDKNAREIAVLNKQMHDIDPTRAPLEERVGNAREDFERESESAKEGIRRAKVYLEELERDKWW